jgi:hypothetical protein
MEWSSKAKSLKTASAGRGVRVGPRSYREEEIMIRAIVTPSRWRTLTVSLLVVGLTACPQRTAVWVENGSTANHLVLRIADKRGGSGEVAIGVIRVYECSGPATGAGAMWVVGPRNGTANVQQIVYGETPPGFVSDQAPQPLKPGCYRVDVSGTGKTEFQVDANGAVSERAR